MPSSDASVGLQDKIKLRSQSDSVQIAGKGGAILADTTTEQTDIYISTKTDLTAVSTGAGGELAGIIRFEEKGSNNNRFHGFELRNRNSGDARILNLDEAATNKSNLIFATDNGTDICERLRLTSAGRLRIKSPSVLNGLQDGRIEWWNENEAGIMAMISCNREATSKAPAGIDFFTSSDVDSSANSSEGDRSLKYRISAVGNCFWYNNRGSGANDQCYYMEQANGTHTWGTVLRLHVNSSGQDRAALVFSSANGWGYNWGIGSPNASNDFRMNSGMGYGTNTWGTTRFRLEHNGTFHGSSSNNISDERLKDNITTITNATAKVKALKGRTFNWQERTGMDTTTKYGFIAQEVNAVVPELVCKENGLFWFNKAGELVAENNDSRSENPDGSSWDIDADGVIPILVEALKEALTEIDTLKTKVAALESS